MRSTLPAAVGQARRSTGSERGISSDGPSLGAVKSFPTGVIIAACGAGGGGSSGLSLEKASEDHGHRRDGGGYCLLRVDSLDRVCEIIYCGQEKVEAKNMSKLVGVQLGYLQVKKTPKFPA